MIVFELICGARHRFEGWFSSGDDFDGQRRRGLIACPTCGNDAIEKLPSARIRKSEQPDLSASKPAPSAAAAEPAMTLHQFIDHVLLNTEDVGGRFAEEARRIHREEAPRRDIRGIATRDETRELLDEGIPVLPLPIPPQGDWH